MKRTMVIGTLLMAASSLTLGQTINTECNSSGTRCTSTVDNSAENGRVIGQGIGNMIAGRRLWKAGKEWCMAHPGEWWESPAPQLVPSQRCFTNEELINQAVTQFLKKHKDFVRSDENASKLIAYMKENNLDPREYKSLDKAFKALKKAGQLNRTTRVDQGPSDPPKAETVPVSPTATPEDRNVLVMDGDDGGLWRSFETSKECLGLHAVKMYGKSRELWRWALAVAGNGRGDDEVLLMETDRDHHVFFGANIPEGVSRACKTIIEAATVSAPPRDSDCDHLRDTEAEGYLQARMWISRHPEFNPTAENAKTLMDYLVSHDLCPNQANLDRAYAAVKSRLK